METDSTARKHPWLWSSQTVHTRDLAQRYLRGVDRPERFPAGVIAGQGIKPRKFDPDDAPWSRPRHTLPMGPFSDGCVIYFLGDTATVVTRWD